MSFSSFCRFFLKEILVLLNSLVFILPSALVLVLAAPFFFIYRQCLALCAKWFYKGKLGKPVTVIGSSFATEFLPSTHRLPTRYAICLQVVVDGKVTMEEMEEALNTRWLSENSPYPEFKQYVEPWMGYMFWKPDHHFNIKNHLKYHPIPGETDEEVEKKLCIFSEEILNKPFPFKRSPWEFHISPNYRNGQLKADCVNDEMTLILFRSHHSLADGFSLLSVMIEGLFNTPLTEIALPTLPTPAKLMGLTSFRKKLVFALTCVPRSIRDANHFLYLPYSIRSLPLSAPKEMRGCRLLHERSRLLPTQKIKDIKNRLGVSFTAVLLTAISVAISKTLHSLQRRNGGGYKSMENIMFGVPLPIPGHSKKLRNQWTGTVLELPTKLELGSLERLKKVEKELQHARSSTRPIIFPLVWKIFGLPFARINRAISKNRNLAVGLSSFPGPAVDIYLNGKKVLLADGLGGLGDGSGGVGFLLLTFRNHIRIATMVVDGIMNREEVKEMLGYVEEEFDRLQELSMKSEKKEYNEKSALPI